MEAPLSWFRLWNELNPFDVSKASFICGTGEFPPTFGYWETAAEKYGMWVNAASYASGDEPPFTTTDPMSLVRTCERGVAGLHPVIAAFRDGRWVEPAMVTCGCAGRCDGQVGTLVSVADGPER